jgi:hypothetical protein
MAMTTPKPGYKELGTPGLETYAGFVAKAYDSALYWPDCYPIYNRLRRSGPECVVIGQAMGATGSQLQIKTELPDTPSDADKEYADFQDSVLGDMEGGIGKWLQESIAYTPFMGWAAWEIVAGVRSADWTAPGGGGWKSEYNDGLIGVQRLAFRDHSSWDSWEMDDKGRVTGMWQNDPPAEAVLLPSSKLVHLRFGDLNNPEGLTPLEAMWRLERIKYGLEVVQGVGFERSAGYLRVEKTEAGALSADDKANVRAAARAVLSAQESNYLLLPYGFKADVIDVSFGAAPAILEAIKFYSTLQFALYGMSFIAMSTLSGTGSYSARSDASQMWLQGFNSMMGGFVDQLDNQLAKPLYDWNKSAFPGVTQRPRLTITKAEKSFDLPELAAFTSAMQAIAPLGEDDLIEVRRRSGFLPEVLPTAPAATPAPAAEVTPPTPAALSLAWQAARARFAGVVELAQGKPRIAELARDFETIKAQYGDKVYKAILEYLSSERPSTKFRNDVKKEMVAAFPETFYLAYANGKREDVEKEDDAWLTARINQELSNIDATFVSMKSKRDDAVEIDKAELIDEANARADGYMRSLSGVYAEGLLRGAKSVMLTMVGEDGADNCKDCKKQKGKRYSARKWIRIGIPGVPGNNYECGGWKCQHGLVTDDGERWLPTGE